MSRSLTCVGIFVDNGVSNLTTRTGLSQNAFNALSASVPESAEVDESLEGGDTTLDGIGEEEDRTPLDES